MGYDATRYALQISDQFLVMHVDDASRRQHVVPMRHQRSVMPVVATKFGEVVSMLMPRGKMRGKAGHTGVGGIAHGMDDGRVGQRQMNEAGEEKVHRHLVGDTRCSGGLLRDSVEIERTQGLKMLRRHVRYHFGKRR